MGKVAIGTGYKKYQCEAYHASLYVTFTSSSGLRLTFRMSTSQEESLMASEHK